jgi:hypothetical protein
MNMVEMTLVFKCITIFLRPEIIIYILIDRTVKSIIIETHCLITTRNDTSNLTVEKYYIVNHIMDAYKNLF